MILFQFLLLLFNKYTKQIFCYRGPPALLVLHLGAVSRQRLSTVELTREYLKHRQLDEAVSLLAAQSWDSDGSAAYACLSAIVNHLLRQPLNADREGR
jgi:hypothetical protein